MEELIFSGITDRIQLTSGGISSFFCLIYEDIEKEIEKYGIASKW